jgi:hypothetical protein
MQQIAVALLPAGSTPAELTIDGHVHLDVRAPGSLQRPAITAEASLDAGHIVWAGEPPATGLVARLSYDAGIVTVSRLETTWQAATVSATGEVPVALVVPGAPVWATGESRVPQPGAGLQVRVDSITPAVLAPFVPPTTVSQLAGLISGTVTLVADRPALRAVRGQIVLDRLDLAFAGVPFA